mgnify:CR=1 FL=1
MSYDTYRLIFIGAAIACGVMFLVSVTLFFVFKIPNIIGNLTGRNAKRRVNEDAPSRSGAGLARLLVVCAGVFSCSGLAQRHVVLGSGASAFWLSGGLLPFLSDCTGDVSPFCRHVASECFGVGRCRLLLRTFPKKSGQSCRAYLLL